MSENTEQPTADAAASETATLRAAALRLVTDITLLTALQTAAASGGAAITLEQINRLLDSATKNLAAIIGFDHRAPAETVLIQELIKLRAATEAAFRANQAAEQQRHAAGNFPWTAGAPKQ